MLRRSVSLLSCLVLHLCLATATRAADPKLSLFQTGTSSSSLNVTPKQLPATLSLDVHLDTAQHSLDGLQLYLQVKPPAPATPTYAGAGSIDAGQSPFPPRRKR